MDQTLNLSLTSETSIEETNLNFKGKKDRRTSIEDILSALDRADEKSVVQAQDEVLTHRTVKQRAYARIQAIKLRAEVQYPSLQSNGTHECSIASTNMESTPSLKKKNLTSIVFESNTATSNPARDEVINYFSSSPSKKAYAPLLLTKANIIETSNSILPSLAYIGKSEVENQTRFGSMEKKSPILSSGTFMPINSHRAVESTTTRALKMEKAVSGTFSDAITPRIVRPIANLHARQNSLLSSPTLSNGSPFGSPYTPNTPQRLGSNIKPISNEYLMKVLTGSNKNTQGSASTIESQKSLEFLPSPNKDKFVKRGSFSMFKKLVESEIQH